MPIIWRDSMAIGQATIDSEHKYLFCLINAVELALKIENAREVVSFYVEQLSDYTREHFTHEEQIQLKIKYPHYAEHKREHQQILDALAELQARLSQPAAATTGALPTVAADAVVDIEDYDPGVSAPEATVAPAQSSNATAASHTDADTEKTLDEVVLLLRHWILDHVLQADMRMKPFLQALKNR